MGERQYLVTREELEEAETVGIPFSQKGAAGGVATLDGETHLTPAQVPPSVVTSRVEALGEVTGNTNMPVVTSGTLNSYISAKLVGNTVLKPTVVPTIPVTVTLLFTQDATGGRTLMIEGAEWVGLEGGFSTAAGAANLLTITFAEGKVLLSQGIGPEGARGNQIYNGAGVPLSNEGNVNDMYFQESEPAKWYRKGATTWTVVAILETLKGEKGATGAQGGGSGAYSGIQMPYHSGNLKATVREAITEAFRAFFCLVVIEKTGHITEILVPNGAVVGNSRAAVFDTGQAEAEHFSVLGETETTKQTGANVFQSIAPISPVAVTAGQVVLLGVMNDATGGLTAQYGFGPAFTTGTLGALPVGLLAGYPSSSGGQIIGNRTFPEMKFAKMTKAQFLQTEKAIILGAKVE
jgi:hypothetical protein